MRRFIPLFVVFLGLGLAFGAGRVLAAIAYGSGTYVNLCGSGTVANRYTCDSGCNTVTGQCQSANKGVVKYICPGRWDQCLDAEGYFSNSESIGTVACGNTVQLSLFDKACRKDDGSWDSSCKLMGYMVWYSGDCWDGTGTPISPLPTRPFSLSPTPTSKLAATVTPTPRLSVTVTMAPTIVASATGTITRTCNKTCGTNVACGGGFSCVDGACRNPSCPSDKSCFCGKPQQTPDTGGELWVLLGIAGFVGGGLIVKKTAKRLW